MNVWNYLNKLSKNLFLEYSFPSYSKNLVLSLCVTDTLRKSENFPMQVSLSVHLRFKSNFSNEYSFIYVNA